MPKVGQTSPTITYMGIDPGEKGGITTICSSGLISVDSMPDTPHNLLEFLKHGLEARHGSLRPIRCGLEKVWARPKQSAPAMWKFGVHYGQLLAYLDALSIPVEEITPNTWIKGLSIPFRKETETPTQWKKRLHAKVQQLYPHLDVKREVADSVLIATYYYRRCEGKL